MLEDFLPGAPELLPMLELMSTNSKTHNTGQLHNRYKDYGLAQR